MIQVLKRCGAFLVLSALLVSSASAEPQRRGREGREGQRGREPVPVGEDEKAGTLQIKSVRMKQGSSGFYVTSGGSYNVRSGSPVDFEVGWSAPSPPKEAPTLRIVWGFAAPTTASCGLCRISKSIPEGKHSMSVLIEDGKGSFAKRTFEVISRP